MKEKVMVGLSGGVDSAVAALILKNQGYEVAGVTLKLKPEGFEGDIADARAVADAVGIPHFVLDLRDKFKETVMDYFVNEYISARTPNPCVRCNKTIKFGAMLDFAKENGYNKIATGHYAKIRYDEKTKKHLLLKSPSLKDQSYFLFELSQYQLANALFPLETSDKSDARELAEKYSLPVAKKRDSREICFVPDNDYVGFIKKYMPDYIVKKGDFLDENGAVLGEHQGIINYTVGQRKGLGTAFGKPMYVSKINALDNAVVLREGGAPYSSRLVAVSLNLTAADKIESGREYHLKIRCQAKPAKAVINMMDNNSFEAVFDEPQRSVTPGQAAVIYDGDIVIGGGTIAYI